MKNPLKVIATLCLIAFLCVTGCHKKESTAEVDNETQSAIDNAVADQEYMAIVPTVQSHAINTKGTGSPKKGLSLPCDSLTLITGDTLWGTPNHINPTYTMSISNASCSLNMPDGRFRTGYIKVQLTGPIKDQDSKMIITYFNYQAALISYDCDSLVVRTVASNTLFTTFNIKLYNGICRKTSTWTIKYSLDRTITSYNKGNPAGGDPVTYIYGSAIGTNRQGRNFTVAIPQATPLIKYRSCEFISGGIMTLTPDGFAARTIDYGYSISPAPYNGCDEDASFTVKGNTVAFKLK